MNSTPDSEGPPSSDEERVRSVIDKYILVGVTTLDHEGKGLQKQELHGVITAVGPHGIEISLRGVHDGQTWTMPPDLDAIFPADPGNYTLRSTKEVVEDPDFLATWTINSAPPEAEC